MPKRPSGPYRLLGAFIASERRRAGLTQYDVGAALGQRESWVRRVERGSSRQRVDVVELLALADASISRDFGCHPLRR
jgi:transcriptional regulator with XRE-family HTH domain